MAKCIAAATGIDSSRRKDTHRFGSMAARVEASTWRTFASAYVSKDGSGYVTVVQNGIEIHRFDFEAEA